jgi:SWIM zinc finger
LTSTARNSRPRRNRKSTSLCAKRFRIASSSKPGSHYFIDVDGSDVICSCPGFEYRGQCKHARDVKSSLAAGDAPPGEYLAVE